MTGGVRALPPTGIEGHRASGLGGPDHPMRIMTRRAAGLTGQPWDDEARAQVAAIFDTLAAEWHTRTSPERAAVVEDALRRGLPSGRDRGDVCVEVGSGIGAYTGLLAERWRRVVAVELSEEMHRRAPSSPGHRVLADGSCLPVADGLADAVVLVNMFLFPAEVARVLAPDGVLVWVNSSGDQTPIHLSSADVVAALGGRWQGIESAAGEGTWCVLWRDHR